MVKDNVKCCNCNIKILVDMGQDFCPVCKAKGTLAWIDGEPKKIEKED